MPFPTGWSAKPPSAFPLLPPSQSKAGYPWVGGFACPSPPGCLAQTQKLSGRSLGWVFYISQQRLCRSGGSPQALLPCCTQILDADSTPRAFAISLSSSCSSEHVDLCNSTIHLAPNTHGGDISPFIIFGQLCHRL